MRKKKSQKSKRWVQVYDMTIKGAALKVNFCTNCMTGVTSLNEYLINVKTGIRHDADVRVGAKAATEADIDHMVNYLIARAKAAYDEKCTAAIESGTGRLSDIVAGLSEGETALLSPPNAQAASTRRQSISFFRTVCSTLDAAGITVCQVNAEEIVRLIREMTEGHKKSKKMLPRKRPFSVTLKRWSGNLTGWPTYGLTRRSVS